MANLVTSEKILPLIEPVLDNSNIVVAIESVLDMIAKYQDQIDIIHKYFKK